MPGKALIATALMLIAGAAMAQDDTAAGKEIVSKRCKTCHSVVDGDNVVVKGGKVGPNLFGVVGRQAGALTDYKAYGDDLAALGATGFAWTEAAIFEYLEDPTNFLRSHLDNPHARSKMSFKLRDEEDRKAAAHFLASLSQ